MPSTFNTATEALGKLVQEGRCVTIETAWRDFLYYLEKRKGADLTTVRSTEDIAIAQMCIEGGALGESGGDIGPSTLSAFNEFERRDDVVKVAAKYVAFVLSGCCAGPVVDSEGNH